MTELAICGVALFLISGVVLTTGFVTGEMPCNYTSVDTKRETAPTTFWALGIFWMVFAALGIAITIRHWGG